MNKKYTNLALTSMALVSFTLSAATLDSPSPTATNETQPLKLGDPGCDTPKGGVGGNMDGSSWRGMPGPGMMPARQPMPNMISGNMSAQADETTSPATGGRGDFNIRMTGQGMSMPPWMMNHGPGGWRNNPNGAGQNQTAGASNGTPSMGSGSVPPMGMGGPGEMRGEPGMGYGPGAWGNNPGGTAGTDQGSENNSPGAGVDDSGSSAGMSMGSPPPGNEHERTRHGLRSRRLGK
ncbi:exported hypothetical protein [Gammaproteobacteria bacterium]